MDRKKRPNSLDLDLTTRYGKIMAWVVGTIFYATFLKGVYDYRGPWAVAVILALSVVVVWRPVAAYLGRRRQGQKDRESR